MSAGAALSGASAGPLKRTTAGLYVALSTALFLGSAWVYRSQAGDLKIVLIELGGADQGTLPAGTRDAVMWDFLLIAGYGLALGLGAVLARRMFWTPQGQRLAMALPWLAAAAVLADLVENVLLLNAIGPSHVLSADASLDGASGAAVIKFPCVLGAGLIGTAAILVTVGRLVWNRPAVLTRRCNSVDVAEAPPLEGDPPGSQAGTATPQPTSRWQGAYSVPDLAAMTGPRVGFCLSGGGIRSGSVALGAIQALRPELRRADYLVSVSGGGYTAGALQQLLTEAVSKDYGPRGTVQRDPATALLPGTVEADRFRRHANYLANSPTRMLIALGVGARVMLVSLLLIFSTAVVLGIAVGRFYTEVPLVKFDELLRTGAYPAIPIGTQLAVGILAALAALCYVAMLVGSATTARSIERPRQFAVHFTELLLLVVMVAIGVPSLVFAAQSVLSTTAFGTQGRFAGSVGTVLLTYLAALASMVWRRRTAVGKLRGMLGKRGSGQAAQVPTGAVQLLLVLLTLATLASAWLLVLGGMATVSADPLAQRVAIGSLIALALLGMVLDETALSLHPFYRRRLANAFAARRVRRSDGHVVAQGYAPAERTTLSTYGSRPKGMPQIIFAAAANLTGEQRSALNAVSFTFSDSWVGGPDVGYARTAQLERAVSPQLRRDLTVQAAVAVSGAAFASAMGKASRWYSTLLAISGVRLGTWLPNPTYVKRMNDAARADDWTLPGLPAVRRLTYLLREIFGIHPCTDRLLQVTDGGHYENLGLLELLRRRCSLIYCIDASGDAPPTAGTLGEAIALARAELGVDIVLDDPWRLVPGSAAPLPPADPLAALNSRLSDRAVICGTIIYPEASGLAREHREGRLVVAKALLTPGMSYDILAYAARHDVFPHDSTGDQFFDDGKFTAYAALGRALGEAALQAGAHPPGVGAVTLAPAAPAPQLSGGDRGIRLPA